MVNLSSLYSLIIAFGSNLRLRLATSTSTFCYVATRLRTLLLHWIVVHATTIVMNSKDLSLNLLWYSITWSSNHLSPRTVLPLFLLRFGLFATSRISAITPKKSSHISISTQKFTLSTYKCTMKPKNKPTTHFLKYLKFRQSWTKVLGTVRT